MKFTQKALTASLMAAGLLFAAGAAQAGAIIINPAGTLLMGINQDGSLNFGEGVTTNGGAGIGTSLLTGGTDIGLGPGASGSATGGAAGIAYNFGTVPRRRSGRMPLLRVACAKAGACR